MVRLRLIGLCCLLALGMAMVQAAPLTKYMLPEQRFKDWTSDKDVVTRTSFCQMWSQPIPNLPKGITGSLLVAYQAVELDTPDAAIQEAKKLSVKDLYNKYVGMGFKVTSDPWPKFREHGVIFSIRGLAHTSVKAHAQSAVIYNLAFAQDTRVVWLQVRQSAVADELDLIDRAMKKVPTSTLAEELTTYVLAQWKEPAPVETPEPATPPAPENTEIILDPTPEKPATPDNPAPAPENTTPENTKPTENTTPENTTPPVAEAPNTPPAAPEKPEGPRWTYEKDLLSFVLPTGWKVSPKAPYQFTGLLNVMVCLYPWEPYKSDASRDKAITSFATDQRDIAIDNFSQAKFTPDGAVGVMVSYTNIEKNTIYGYYFAKSGRLWQLLISIPGKKAPLPDVVKGMVESLKVQ